jgi:hypothetical protein
MDIRIRDRVHVNLAPFIGLPWRSKESVPCEVTAVDGTRIRLTTAFPYRTLDLWIQDRWIEGMPQRTEALGAQEPG